MREWLARLICIAAILVTLTACGTQTSTLPKPFKGEIIGLNMLNRDVGWASGLSSSGEAAVLATNDGGHTWRRLTPPQLHSVPRLSMDPVSRSEAWIATVNSKGRVDACQTRTSGRSWQCFYVTAPNGEQVRALWPSQVDFINASTGWIELQQYTGLVSARAALWQTLDGGRTWQQLFPLAYSGFGMAGPVAFSSPKLGVHIVSTSYGYGNGLGGPGVYTTTNGGHSWTSQFLPDNMKGKNQKALPAYGMQAVSDDAQLWIVRRDRISSALSIGAPIVDLFGRDMVAAAFGDPLESHNDAITYFSYDAGQHWLRVLPLRSPLDRFISAYAQYSITQLDFINRQVGFLVLSKRDVLRSVMFRTVDGGTHWEEVWASPTG